MALDYVKFQRGTPEEYSILQLRNRVENNTLYFIYENGASSGSLYLGNVLIGTVGEGSSSVSKLSDLSDVLLTNVGATDILVYSSDGKWKNTSIQEIADLIASQEGLGFNINENQFNFQSINGTQTLSLLGFEGAAAGASPIKGTNGKLSWSNTNVDILASTVETLSTSFENLRKDVAQQIVDANHLKYEVVSSLDDMSKDNVVYLLPKSETEEHNGYDEFMIVNGSLERLGDWKVDLNGYATTEQLQEVVSSLDVLSNSLNDNYITKDNFNSIVGDLTALKNYENNPATSLVNEINALYNLFENNQAPTYDKIGDSAIAASGLIPGTEITRVGGGVEYYPLGGKDNRDVRLHAAYAYNFGDNTNPDGTALGKGSFQIGRAHV